MNTFNKIKHAICSSTDRLPSRNPLLAALIYADTGLRVLPVRANSKVPLIRAWQVNASTDFQTIQHWWKKHPSSNVGIATGRKSGIFVIDIDCKRDVYGMDSIMDTFGDIELNRDWLIAISPTGGVHFYFQWDESIPVTVASHVLPGVDIRGESGFIMAAPSTLKIDGELKGYFWNNFSNYIPKAPEWAYTIAQRSLQKSDGRLTPRVSKLDLTQIMAGVPEGNRDDALFRYSCHLRGRHVPLDLAIGFIKEASARCTPPFPEDIAIEKVVQAYSKLNQSFDPHQNRTSGEKS